jgi:hypothetical protein
MFLNKIGIMHLSPSQETRQMDSWKMQLIGDSHETGGGTLGIEVPTSILLRTAEVIE